MLKIVFKILTFILIFRTVRLSDQSDRSITILSPKFIGYGSNYKAFVIPRNVDQPLELNVILGSANQTLNITNDQPLEIDLPKEPIIRSNNKFLNLKIVLKNTATGQCLTKISRREFDPKSFLRVFIQTDKPAYKPGDEVKFRVLVLDNQLKPTHYNTLQIDILDIFDRLIKTFDDDSDQFQGMIHETFKLSEGLPLGAWKIRVTVENTVKVNKFIVQETSLPEFFVDLSTKLVDSSLTIDFGAKYAFGDFASGSALLTIQGTDDHTTYFQKAFSSVNDFVRQTLVIRSDDLLKLDAIVTYTEQSTGLAVNKTNRVCYRKEGNYKILPKHAQKFLPGQSFRVTCTIFNQQTNQQVMKDGEEVHMVLSTILANGRKRQSSRTVEVRNGGAEDEFFVPLYAKEIELEVRFKGATYKKTIERGEVNVLLDKLAVSHQPKKLNLENNTEIFISNATEIDTIYALVMSRLGNVESRKVNCANQEVCKFKLRVTERMMPKVTVAVYFIKDSKTIYQGSTDIETESFGGNFLNMKVPQQATPGQKVEMEFESKPGSHVFLLAYDKRSLNEGLENEITKGDVLKEVANFDDQIEAIYFDLNSWNDCTNEDMIMLNGKRRGKRSGDEIFSLDFDFDGEEYNEMEETNQPSEKDFDSIREHFPDVWMFSDFIVEGSRDVGNINKEFVTPDTITTWRISAFAMNSDYGLAIADPKELTVKNDFFIQAILPYSIRYKEVLRVDVLVFNYMDGGSSVDVEVKMHRKESDEFQFVDYDNNCIESYNSSLTRSKFVNVKKKNVEKVSFYIRPYSNQYTLPDRIEIIVDAKANSGQNDAVRKYLKVQPIGVKYYRVDTRNLRLIPGRPQTFTDAQPRRPDSTKSYPKFSVFINAENNPDVTVTVQNDGNFTQTVRITKDSSCIKYEIELPDYSLEAKVTASGSGLCTISTQIEETVKIHKTSKSIRITARPLETGTGGNEEIVEVCATYTPRIISTSLMTLENVIYDIDIPSGYQYVDIANFHSIRKQLKLIEPRNKISRVTLYYNDFEMDKKYCVQVRVRKVAEVNDSQSASVLVYDFNDKENVATAFYKFSKDECV